jgi:uncharacterized phage infection (PIP) family protein YhgE
MVVDDLRTATNILLANAVEGGMSGRFEQINLELAKRPLLGAPWHEYRVTLLIPTEPGRPIFTTERPENWFDIVSLFRRAGRDLRFHAAFPGILVGSGLLVTFLGLTVALRAAGGVVSGTDPVSRLHALQGLLDAASLKFITSLAGLFLSITYALARKHQLYRVEIAHEAFLHAINREMPFKAAALLQFDTNELLRKQYTEVQRIGVDFFVNLGSVLEREFSSGLQAHLAPLAAAIERLAAKETEQSEGAIGTMLSQFLERLEGSVGESMRSTTATLQSLEAGLSGLRGAMDEAANRMARAAEEMTKGMSRGAQDALAGVTTEIAALVQTMRAAADEAGQNNRLAGEQLAKQMAATADSLTRAVELFRQRMEEGAAQGVERLAEPLQAMLRQLKDLAEGQRSAGTESSKALADTMQAAAASLEATAERMSSSLGAGAANASERLVTATEAMREELRLVLERFETALSVAGASVEQNARASGVALTDAAARAGGDFAAIAKKLAEAGDSAGTALRAGGADARLHMAEASRLLAESAAGLGGRLAAIAEATDGLAARAIELQEAARSATTPLQVTAQDLRQAAVATREAAAPLADAGATVRAAMDGLRQASDSVTAAYRQADALATSLGDASDRFKGVDQVIGKTTDELTKGVRELERQFGDFVRGMDKGLGDSLQQLAAIAEGLEESAKEIAGANKTSRVLP